MLFLYHYGATRPQKFTCSHLCDDGLFICTSLICLSLSLCSDLSMNNLTVLPSGALTNLHFLEELWVTHTHTLTHTHTHRFIPCWFVIDLLQLDCVWVQEVTSVHFLTCSDSWNQSHQKFSRSGAENLYKWAIKINVDHFLSWVMVQLEVWH